MKTIHTLLGYPALYLLSQTVMGACRARKLCIEGYVEAVAGDRILDVGCGPGYVVRYLPKVAYVGFDTDSSYIEYANNRYGDHGRFFCGLLTAERLSEFGSFDKVMLMGVLHHLDDETASDLLTLALNALVPGGRVVALEGCYVEGQSAFAKKMLDMDRGEFVRNENGYRSLAERIFNDVRIDIRHDLFYIPYTKAVITCTKPET